MDKLEFIADGALIVVLLCLLIDLCTFTYILVAYASGLGNTQSQNIELKNTQSQNIELKNQLFDEHCKVIQTDDEALAIDIVYIDIKTDTDYLELIIEYGTGKPYKTKRTVEDDTIDSYPERPTPNFPGNKYATEDFNQLIDVLVHHSDARSAACNIVKHVYATRYDLNIPNQTMCLIIKQNLAFNTLDQTKPVNPDDTPPSTEDINDTNNK